LSPCFYSPGWRESPCPFDQKKIGDVGTGLRCAEAAQVVLAGDRATSNNCRYDG